MKPKLTGCHGCTDCRDCRYCRYCTNTQGALRWDGVGKHKGVTVKKVAP